MSVRLLDITATAHRDGNRIDLAWRNPDPGRAPGVRVVRREGTHPAGPDDGFTVAHALGLNSASDTVGLQGETVYYYTLFPFSGFPAPAFDPDPHNQASAMAISPYDFAGRLYAMLPAVYRRYDAERTPPAGSGLPAADRDKGQLRRFLDLPGGELDRLYSFTRAALAFADLNRVDGRLLPLLAQWIGWQTDFGLPLDAQRNEIRFAPRIYRTTGGVPTLDATVARVTGWGNRTKEFVHNVARTNQPERLNLWSALRDTAGSLTAPALASVNFAYDGRPAAVQDEDGSALFFYHTYRQHGWDIWSKRFAAGAWQPSRPVVDQPGIDKHPSTALQLNKLWLFWQSYDPERPPADRKWRVFFSTRTGTTWTPPAVFGDPATERRMPTAVADNTGGVWLFWLELTGGTWQLRYNRHNGAAWQLDVPQTLPLDGGQAPRVEDDLFALFHPTSTTQRLWLFWARREPGGPAGQTRWSIVHRVKQGLDPAAADWSAIRALPKAGAGGYHDRQPAPLLTANGNIELFWSSTQRGGWSILRNTLTVSTLTWGTNQPVVGGPYARRGPLAVDTGAGTLLTYRSNESLTYDSSAYGATHTLDHRYAGTTTVDTGGTAKLALRGTFEDFQTYTYDAGSAGTAGSGRVRTNDNRIARDTVGLYLNPDITDPDEIKAVISRLAGVLADVIPATSRPVFITP
ncbi:hypothetical protein [Streptomyces sp. H27-D2]|uniref:hypothetical protein n=1 Tax=Streptomyces sp. H27-D2 TaxID=3046304 RepID=UPI002DBF7B1B|nr:hypothetical protein [Streptomyces sp. H27-D2]MEC4018810.1 hypothetical protein [Streptomyces sp. H27-D2]